ncbi:MAG: type III PLP-dependent enzyme [Hyphomonadaceae bacterium]|nr:type III PLP-dependent enzyme [Hyphomonadaceae bacterium]
MDSVFSTQELVRTLAPEEPVIVARPHRVALAARWFARRFPGAVFYAVKANPADWVLDALWDAGVRAFDVASEHEVRQVRERYPGARLAFTHPVKGRGAIRRAYAEHGVRIFALDTAVELDKILDETGGAADLELLVRIAVPGESAHHRLDRKFGVQGAEAAALLRSARASANTLGVAFHVGSQCLRPDAFGVAMDAVAGIIRQAAVTIDIVDVGGGFPSPYAAPQPPAMQLYVDAITDAFADMPVLKDADLWCEPGRALVAEASSHLVKVELRKGDRLYINEGSYGALFDAAHCGIRYPVRLVRNPGAAPDELRPYEFYGPTCDSIDHMRGPFFLPADVREGDYVEIGMTGAYCAALASRFNGFGAAMTVFADDAPMRTMYPDADAPQRIEALEAASPL